MEHVIAAEHLADANEQLEALSVIDPKPRAPASGAREAKVKSRDEHLTWAKQRALLCVDMGDFIRVVRGLRADLAEHSLTNGLMSSDQALRGYKAAMDAALGRGSQALTKWIEDFK